MTLSNGCHLVTTDGRQLPLRSVDLDVDAAGGLAQVRLRQTFTNPHAEPLAVTYQLPLPADGAVVDFRFVLDGTVVEGVVQERSQARETFERAVLEGRTAALLEQERSSLFTQELGNLPAGAVLEVELVVEQRLAWKHAGWEWRFPTVVAPRYLGERTPDAPAVTVGVADTDPAIPCRVTVRHDGADASSPSHDLRDDAGATVLLGTLDRDVVVRWRAASPQVGVTLETCTHAGQRYGLLTVVPPAVPTTPVPRDVLLLLDTSGSMRGAPMAQLQAACSALVEGLSPADSLEMIEFSSRPSRWREAPVTMDDDARTDAVAWLRGLQAGGGTAMHHAICAATATLRPEATRQVVLVTDGLIGFEAEILGHLLRELPAGCRFHTLGIGHASNRTLTGGVARAGGGHETIVTPEEPVTHAVQTLLAHTAGPQITGWQLEGAEVIAPARLPELMAGAPVRVSVRLGEGPVVVRGRTAQGSWQATAVPQEGDRRVVVTRFARERVADLELSGAAGEAVDDAITALGISHRIATRLTSWVAVSDAATVRPGEPTRRVTVPQALPAGMSAGGVGLRAPLPSSPPMMQAMAASMAPPMPAAPRRRAKLGAPKRKAERFLDSLRSLGGGLPADEAEEEVAEESPGGAPPRRRSVRARLKRVGDRWVIEVDGPGDWDASGILQVRLADGTVVRVRAAAGTTEPTTVPASTTARLVLQLPGTPVHVTLRTLELEL